MVLVPSYKAAEHLRTTLPAIIQAVGVDNVLVVDDGSGDATPAVCAEYPGLHFIGFPENRGKGSALTAGIAYAHEHGRDWCLSMDADGQHSVDDIPAFLFAVAEAKADCGILAGARNFTLGVMPFARILSNVISTWMVSWVAGAPVFDAQCGYRMYRTSMGGQGIFPAAGRFEWEPAVLVNAVRQGFGVARVPVRTLYPEGVGSHISHFRDIMRFLRMLWKLKRQN
jgi:glycosyltransferase involved in cell wall biosynthesis